MAPQFPAPALQQLMRIAQQDIGSLTQAAAAAGYRMVPLLLPLVNTLLAHIDQQQEAGTADEELLKCVVSSIVPCNRKCALLFVASE